VQPGGREEPLFADDAAARLHRVSNGLPRALNNAAVAALIAAAADGKDLIDDACAATEVARRAGHSVAVLLKVYAHCMTARPTPSTSASPTPSVARMIPVPDQRGPELSTAIPTLADGPASLAAAGPGASRCRHHLASGPTSGSRRLLDDEPPVISESSARSVEVP
jgi:hypothetical protein